MEVVYKRCCGMDVHRDTVTACLVTGRKKEMRTFQTTTDQLRSLAAWLNQADCGAAAMESTGVYWKPVYNILELTGIELMVVNARHIKAVPGRKTDVKDAEWIADLLRHGLLRASFVPERPQRELQELVRYRRSLLHERTSEVNRLHKVLHGANIKLSTVLTDIMGASGRDIISALAAGETDCDKLLAYIRPSVKATADEIRAALEGQMGEHQRQMLTAQLAHVDSINREIEGLDQEIERRLAPSEPVIRRLDTVPGIGRIGAQEIIAAIGTDMSRFPTSAHLASWAKVCPGTNESAGKRKSARTGKGSPYLRATLVEAARAAARCEKTYLCSQYHRLKARRGTQKAAMAVAHTILVIAYHVIKDNTVYQDLGTTHIEEQRSEALARQLIRQLERMGHKVVAVKDAG